MLSSGSQRCGLRPTAWFNRRRDSVGIFAQSSHYPRPSWSIVDVAPAGHRGCCPLVVGLHHTTLPVVGIADCTAHTEQDTLHPGRSPAGLGFVVGFRAVDNHLAPWALCIHLFRRSHHRDSGRPACCPGHDLLESDDRRICSRGQLLKGCGCCPGASLGVVHSLKSLVGFRFRREPHKPKPSAAICVAVFDDNLDDISHPFTSRRRIRLPPPPPCRIAGTPRIMFRR
ncbi:uncharacterized protein PV07_11426 [Cladophialophora immunda]|uniref:Uncharacterized protein n=1 Tax=Cladophialophora immunda TaxID=569365 RepID=A0A0D1Z6G3_9EURO|nr:uncharacterized protein PV07_11426 [Cladophialophora immunda]KIW23206.1 hypothetical protein PV07_11426 [Cladophialophora immunda]